MKPDIDAIRERAAAATPGPWKVTESRGDCGDIDQDCGKEYCDEECKKCEHFKFFEGAQIDKILTLSLDEWDGMNDADADFIAHARTDIPALLAYIAELEQERYAAIIDMKLLANEYGFCDMCKYFNSQQACEEPHPGLLCAEHKKWEWRGVKK